MNLDLAKKELAKILNLCGLLPTKQGQVTLHISPEGNISSIEVQVTYK